MEFRFINRFILRPKLKGYSHARESYLKRVRWAVSLFYFSTGLCSASWASRIPDLKAALHLSESDLGAVLFSIPFGQLFIMPFSGKLVTRYGSHKILALFLIFYALSMVAIGLASRPWHLSLALFFFGIFGNLSNIAVNTQGIYVEGIYRRGIMSSFHGAWSTAGFAGALAGLAVLALDIRPFIHFLGIFAIVLLILATQYGYLIKAKAKIKAERKKFFARPDSELVWLGVIGFCCMASEGVMFDWSGVYFKDIIKAPKALAVLGYTSFMVMMAGGRFFGDRIILKFGRKKVVQASGILISIGLFAAVFLPYLVPATLSFMLVGLGVSTIVPTVYSIAGKNPTVPPGEALTIVSSVSFLGFLIGPPAIGYVAEAFGLQFSFAFIGMFGFLIACLASKIRAFKT
ncbi:MAG TPA: MFS transporter [Flavobacterium sp.]|nr:MFS transporter [Flavobacterium sp.]